MSGIVKWVIKLIMTMVIVLTLFKQCMLRPEVGIEGLKVTGISLYRLSLKDTANLDRIYYLVRPEGYLTYNIFFSAIFQSRPPMRDTPVNIIDDVSFVDSTFHNISRNIHYYNEEYRIRGIDKLDTVIYIDTYNENLKGWNSRIRNKYYSSATNFVFYVDKSAPQPYEIRMWLDSCEVRSRVKKDTMRWMFR